MNVYFFSGLGADRRAFSRISLPGNYNLHFIEWIPHRTNETLEAYALRLAAGIDQNHPYILIGLSFGGMIATTLKTLLHPAMVICISTICCSSELPWYYRWIARSRVDTIVPTWLFHPKNPLIYFLFGAKTSSQKKILAEILRRNSPHFLKWGIRVILRWSLKERPPGIYHIHGDNDRVLPAKYTCADYLIRGGTHFMIWTKAAEVNKVIHGILSGTITVKQPGKPVVL